MNMNRSFKTISDGAYSLDCPKEGLRFVASRLNWERGELKGVLKVECDLAGAQTVNGVLSVANFTVTSASARKTRAKDLESLANADEISFSGLLEELCQQVICAEERGKPLVLLRNIEDTPDDDGTVYVDSFPVLLKHPSIIFGDGGTGKSTLGLYIAGKLELMGYSVAYLDWELDGRDHRRQLRRLFGNDLPDIKYMRCDRPLTIEAQGLAAQINDTGVQYVICDSIAFACDGPPEQAEVAQRYLRALRQLNIGSLNFAHTTKGDDRDKRPFGSTFWYNGARQVWFAKRDDDAVGSSVVPIALYDRKFNLGASRSDLGFEIDYSAARIAIRPCDLTRNNVLAKGLSIAQRIRARLHDAGERTIRQLAEDLGSDEDTIRRTVDRNHDLIKVPQETGTAVIKFAPRRKSA